MNVEATVRDYSHLDSVGHSSAGRVPTKIWQILLKPGRQSFHKNNDGGLDDCGTLISEKPLTWNQGFHFPEKKSPANTAKYLDDVGLTINEAQDKSETLTTAERLIDVARIVGGAELGTVLQNHPFLRETKLHGHFEKAIHHIVSGLKGEQELHPEFPATQMFDAVLNACISTPRLVGHLANVGITARRLFETLHQLAIMQKSGVEMEILNNLSTTTRECIDRLLANPKDVISQVHVGGLLHDIGKDIAACHKLGENTRAIFENPAAMGVFEKALKDPEWVETCVRGGCSDEEASRMLALLKNAFTDVSTLQNILRNPATEPELFSAVTRFWQIAIHDHITSSITKNEKDAIDTHAAVGLEMVRDILRDVGAGHLLPRYEGTIAGHHHSIDTGKPTLEQLIITVADVLDALNRPCNTASEGNDARKVALRDIRSRVIEMLASTGRQFDSDAARLLLFVYGSVFDAEQEVAFSVPYNQPKVEFLETRDETSESSWRLHANQFVDDLQAMLHILYPLTPETKTELVKQLTQLLKSEADAQAQDRKPFRLFYKVASDDTQNGVTTVEVYGSHNSEGFKIQVQRQAGSHSELNIRAEAFEAVSRSVRMAVSTGVFHDPASSPNVENGIPNPRNQPQEFATVMKFSPANTGAQQPQNHLAMAA